THRSTHHTHYARAPKHHAYHYTPDRHQPLAPLSHHVVAASFDQDDHVLMNHSLPFRARRRWAACLILLASAVVFSDEWKARHPLIPPSGVMNLPEPPPPGEVFFSGPQDPADAGAWLDGLKSWRIDR